MTLRTSIQLEINSVYLAQLVMNGKIRSIRFLGAIQTNGILEICFHVIQSNNAEHAGCNFFKLSEIGIGLDNVNAAKNYGKVNSVHVESYYENQEELIAQLQKIPVSPKRYEYYNLDRDFVKRDGV